MNRFGTTLGQWLYWLLLILQLLLLLALLAGVMLTGLGLFAPGTLVGETATVNGQLVPITPTMTMTLGLFVIGASAAAGYVAAQLIGLMRTVAQGTPFIIDNVRRLRAIAVMFVALMVVKLVMPLFLTDEIGALIMARTIQFDLSDLLVALLLLVLAEVFRAGVALREDAEGTI